MKHYNLNLDEVSVSDVLKIQEKRRIKSFTETIRYCLAETYAKEFPEYIQVAKKRASVTTLDKAKAADQVIVDKERLKQERIRQANIAICNLLDESVISTHPELGYETCYYPEFECNGPTRTSKNYKHVALIDLNDETPSLQYSDLMGNTGKIGRENWLKQKKENDIADAKRAQASAKE